MSHEEKIDPDRTYSVGAAARLLGVSPSTVRDLERRGALVCSRTPGGQRRIVGVALLQLRSASAGAPLKTPAPPSPPIAASAEDAKARHAWLGHWIARAQRELPADTPADIRLRLAAELERALAHWGPGSPTGDVEPLVKSLVERANTHAETAHADTKGRAMKGELVEFGLAQLRRSIDALPTRVVGAPGSLMRRHIQATLRDQCRGLLQTRLGGHESWDQVRELAEECLAAWFVAQAPNSRIPTTVKIVAAGATGLLGGATAAAALSPAIRAQAVKFKDPLLSVAAELLKNISSRPPSTSPPPSPPTQTTTTPPPFKPWVGGVWSPPYPYRRPTRYARPVTPTPHAAAPGGPTAAGAPAPDAAAPNPDAAPQAPPEAPDPA